MPSRDQVTSAVEALRSALFPGYFGVSDLNAESMRFHVGATLDQVLRVLQEQIKRGPCFECGHYELNCPECDAKSGLIVENFLQKLPGVQHTLATDVQAAYCGDPAAKSTDETVFCYPGVLAVTCYRLAHELSRLGVPLIPRIITEHAHSLTGVVIGETCIIGKRVRIYQGVTLGAKSFPLDSEGKPIKGIERHPIVEDDVIIYSGTTVLGRVVIGRGSIIGGNLWITGDVLLESRLTASSLDRTS